MRWPFSEPDKHNQCFVKRFVSTYDFRGTWVEIHDRAIADSYHDDIVRINTKDSKLTKALEKACYDALAEFYGCSNTEVIYDD